MELKKSCLDVFEASGTIQLTQEETAETIVPDYCPDIARIIKTDGKVYLHSRELRDGRGEVNGTVKLCVLYTPDGEKGLRTLEFALPFSAASERGSFPKCQTLLVESEIAALETRMLNPRKVFTRCKLLLRLTGYQKKQLVFGTDLEAESALCVEQKQSTETAVLLTGVHEKDFSFTDEVQLSPAREGAAELLCCDVCASVAEAKGIGNKLIFRGSFLLRLLYRSNRGTYECCTAELPFSQVMEVEAEDAAAEICLSLTGADFQLDGGDSDGRQVSLTLYLHATALLYRQQELTLLEDLYSTAYAMDFDAAPLDLTAYRETVNRRQSVREILEIGVVAESILSLSACCGTVTMGKEGQNTILRSSVSVRALYQDEGGAVLFAERTVEVSTVMELPPEAQVTAEAAVCEEVQGSIGERGIEVRFPVDFTVHTHGKKRKVCICEARIQQDAPKDIASAPSLVLRRLGREEKAWDLAKRYHTTIGDILAANGLENESEIPCDKLLLIPKKRA